jgi:hypothetical protein
MYTLEYWHLIRAWPVLARTVGLAPGSPARELACYGVHICALQPGQLYDTRARVRAINARERALRAARDAGHGDLFSQLKQAVCPGDILLMVWNEMAFSPYTHPPRFLRSSNCGLRWRLPEERSAGLVFNEDPARRLPLSGPQLWAALETSRQKTETSLAAALCLARLGLPGEIAWCVVVLAFWADGPRE